jgi:hypothetical protein
VWRVLFVVVLAVVEKKRQRFLVVGVKSWPNTRKVMLVTPSFDATKVSQGKKDFKNPKYVMLHPSDPTKVPVGEALQGKAA